MKTKMKVLVFDDTEINRKSAVAQLGQKYDLTVVGNYGEAEELLVPRIDRSKAESILREKFGDFDPHRTNDKVKRNEYFTASEVANRQSTIYPDFDVVLTDLLVRASGNMQASMRLVGTEMPVGVFIGLLAAVKGKAKYVAVFTDTNHHNHPASACFDEFNKGSCGGGNHFTVEGSKFLLCNESKWSSQYDPKDLSKELSYEEYDGRSDTVRAKNWSALLTYLLK